MTQPDYPQGGGRGEVGPARARETVRRAMRGSALRWPELFAAETRLVVAFSGGQDSTCLLHALTHANLRLDLVAAHVDHGLRSDSAADAQRVVASAEAMGVACEVVRVDVAGLRQRMKRWSIQQAARAVRYQALASIAERNAAAALLVAHTADDQAETVLLNLLRGAGLMGLAGMRAEERLQQGVRLVRPLLRVPRATTRAYCSHFGLGLVEDTSNQNRAYTRNRVRLDLLPALERFNPAIRDVLSRTAELAADDVAALDAIVAERYAEFARQTGPGEQVFDRRVFLAQRRAVQRRLLRLGIASVGGFGLVDVGAKSVEDALELLQTGSANQTYHLPYGVELHMDRQSFVLRREGRARHRLDTTQKSWVGVGPRV